MVKGHTFARSTKTGDKKLARQLVSMWEQLHAISTLT